MVTHQIRVSHPYGRRAGNEGTISQGVRVFGRRQARYRGPAKTHILHIATAVAINLARIDLWFAVLPRVRARLSRLATLGSLT